MAPFRFLADAVRTKLGDFRMRKIDRAMAAESAGRSTSTIRSEGASVAQWADGFNDPSKATDAFGQPAETSPFSVTNPTSVFYTGSGS